MLMSIKILQTEGIVVPISGKLCQTCKNSYDQKYGGKQLEKVVVYVPRTGKQFMNLYTYCFIQLTLDSHFARSYSELNVSMLTHICIGMNYVDNLNAPFVEKTISEWMIQTIINNVDQIKINRC